MNAYAKCFDKNSKYTNLLVNDKEMLEKYNKIWNNIKNLLKNDLMLNQCIMINILKLQILQTTTQNMLVVKIWQNF